MAPRGRPLTISDAQLLDCSRDLFLERGLDATTVEIAERAGISESVIFYRYKTKEALFLAVVERALVLPPVFEELASRAGQGEIAEVLFQVGSGLVQAMESVLPFMMMAFSSPRMNVLAAHGGKPHAMRARILATLSGYFDGEVRRGRLRWVNPEILANTFLGAIADSVMKEAFEHRAMPPPLQVATFLRGMIDILLNGAVKPAAGAPPRPRRRRNAKR